MSTQLLIPEVQEVLISNLRTLIQGTETQISSLKADLKARKKDLKRWQSSLAKETGEKPVNAVRKPKMVSA
ncbi:MAG: hypothetical protein FJW34_16555 [Acidobacteria bacterium]|nr:hypothetical protein [Acidobacteriota bacterium]